MEVVIEVHGGVAEVVLKDQGFRVVIRDYDNTRDHEGNDQECSEAIWEQADIEGP